MRSTGAGARLYSSPWPSGSREAIDLNRCLKLRADEDLLWAAGLFHDSGKGLEPHWISSKALVLEHLAPLADSEEALDRIAYLVRYHAKRSDPALLTTELKLLQDADILDHRGCMQIWLAVGGAVSDGRDPEQIAAEWDGSSGASAERSSGTCCTLTNPSGRFDERLARETAFYNAVKAEISGQ